MLDESLRRTEGLTHLRFSWRTALLGSYDAFHFHWPEVLSGGRTPIRRLVRRALLQTLLIRLRLQRIPIVRTIHNLELPSGMSAWERRMLSSVRDRAQLGIALNTQTQASGPTVVIPHGHYIDWFDGMERVSSTPQRIAFVGLIRRYKGVEALIDAYSRLRERRDDVTLAISGRPTSDELSREIRDRADEVPGVSVRFEYLTEPAYVRAVTESALVVLPYVHMHNSGSALAALSLSRPVLVPDNEVNRALSDEVGPGWVRVFQDSLDDGDLERAVAVEQPPDAMPDLSARDWSNAGVLHLRAYRQAVASKRRKGAR